MIKVAVLASFIRTPLIRNRVNDFNIEKSLKASEAQDLAVFKTTIRALVKKRRPFGGLLKGSIKKKRLNYESKRNLTKGSANIALAPRLDFQE